MAAALLRRSDLDRAEVRPRRAQRARRRRHLGARHGHRHERPVERHRVPPPRTGRARLGHRPLRDRRGGELGRVRDGRPGRVPRHRGRFRRCPRCRARRWSPGRAAPAGEAHLPARHDDRRAPPPEARAHRRPRRAVGDRRLAPRVAPALCDQRRRQPPRRHGPLRDRRRGERRRVPGRRAGRLRRVGQELPGRAGGRRRGGARGWTDPPDRRRTSCPLPRPPSSPACTPRRSSSWAGRRWSARPWPMGSPRMPRPAR